jgi:hypothetical protein
MRSITGIIKRNRGLIWYTGLNYFDKLLIFLTPLLVLYVFDNKGLYNDIEYILSLAAIFGVFIELGIANYFLYGYKEAKDRDLLVTIAHQTFQGLFLVYSVIAIIGIVIGLVMNTNTIGLWLFVVIRVLFMYFVQFYSIYYRIIDKPSKIFAFSCSVNLLTVVTVLVMHVWFGSIDLFWFFSSQVLLCIVMVGYVWLHWKKINWNELVGYTRKALLYAWPITLNVLLYMIVSNFGKVYARNYLSESEMFQLSFVQRLTLIIHLAHVSAIGYLSKDIFVDERKRAGKKIFTIYSIMIVCAGMGVIALLIGNSLIRTEQAVKFNIVSISIIATTLLSAYAAYFELYLNKINKTRYILYSAAISTIVFAAILGIHMGPALVRIALAMVGSMTVKLVMVLFFLRRFSMLSKEAEKMKALERGSVDVEKVDSLSHSMCSGK